MRNLLHTPIHPAAQRSLSLSARPSAHLPTPTMFNMCQAIHQFTNQSFIHKHNVKTNLYIAISKTIYIYHVCQCIVCKMKMSETSTKIKFQKYSNPMFVSTRCGEAHACVCFLHTSIYARRLSHLAMPSEGRYARNGCGSIQRARHLLHHA